MGLIDKVVSLFSGSGLPSWAKERDGKIYVNPDKVYPLYLEKLGVTEVDQYWLEVARRCFTEDLKKIVGGPIHLVIERGAKNWALRDYPAGLGDVAGSMGFRQHYEQISKG